MEKSLNNKFKLGIFVLIGLGIFVFAIFWIGRQKHLFDQTFPVSSVFSRVSGLQVGNNVRFAGINVGTVDGIAILNDTAVRVDLLIKSSVREFIHEDGYAVIGSEGLMGDRIVNIFSGTPQSRPIKDGFTLTSYDPVETDEIMGNLKVTTDNAAVITDQLAEIMIKVNSGQGTLGKLIQDSTLANDFRNTVSNLKQGTKGFSENMEAAKNNFLLKGFFKRKQREQDKAKKEAEQKQIK
jgi:phospholipid/cholesterol/gamma-HCH transport system substrate-binding protein